MPNTQFPKVLSNALYPAPSIEGKDTTIIGKDALGLPKDSVNLVYGGRKHYTQSASPNVKVVYGSPQDRNSFYGGRKHYTHGFPQDVNGYDHENVFFLENDLRAGQKLKQRFSEPVSKAKFIPRKVADNIPFSGKKLPEILKRFAIEPRSFQAEIVEQTIRDCEEPAVEGESKICATSPESLIDFSVSELGTKKVQVFTTEVVSADKSKDTSKLQEYTVAKGGRKIGDSAVVCHRQNYVYAVFYCHEIEATSAYMVSLVAADGTRANAVALCHRDTRLWNPQHVAFQMLKVKPGTVPICHFVARNNLVWVPN